MKLRVHDIIEGTTVDGPGFRTSIYFAGCEHHCPGCHNPQTWDPAGGEEISDEDLVRRIKELGMPVTLSGGDPLFQYNETGELCRMLKEAGFEIWVYTGYIYEDIAKNEKYRKILENVDVIVDGPFIEKLKNTDLIFKGSSNQRIIDIKKTIEENEIIIWESDF